MGKSMDKDDVIFPEKGKEISPSGFVWTQAEKVIVERIGDKNAELIKKTEALEAVKLARTNQDLKEAYIKIGTLRGESHLVLRIKAKRLLKDYEDDHILLKDYKSIVQQYAESRRQVEAVEKNLKTWEHMQSVTRIREESLELAANHVQGLKKQLEQVKSLRKRGAPGLEEARRVRQQAEKTALEFAHGDFQKNRSAFVEQDVAELEKDPQLKTRVSELRKRSQEAFDSAMRLAAEARDLKDEVVAEVLAHEFDVEKDSAEYLKSDELRLEQLKKLVPIVDKLVKHDLFERKKLEGWEKIKSLTETGLKAEGTQRESYHNGYLKKCQEANESFRAAASLKPAFNTVQKQFALLMSGTPGSKAKEAIYKEFTRLSGPASVLKNSSLIQTQFEQLMQQCDEKWKQVLG